MGFADNLILNNVITKNAPINTLVLKSLFNALVKERGYDEVNFNTDTADYGIRSPEIMALSNGINPAGFNRYLKDMYNDLSHRQPFNSEYLNPDDALSEVNKYVNLINNDDRNRYIGDKYDPVMSAAVMFQDPTPAQKALNIALDSIENTSNSEWNDYSNLDQELEFLQDSPGQRLARQAIFKKHNK